MTFRTIGGALDFFIFLGPQPEDVVKQYTQLIGRPMIPPYYGLGFQLCKYGYQSVDEIKEVVNRTKQAKIPQVSYISSVRCTERSIIYPITLQF